MRGDERRGQALAGDVGRALTDHLDPADAAVAQALAHGGGEHVVVERHLHPTVALHELAAQRLAEARRRLGDLLQQEVRVGATVDVPGRDLCLLHVGLRHGQQGAVVGLAGDPVELAGAGAVEDDDLTAAGVRVLRVGGRVAVEPDVAPGQLDEAVRLGGDDEAAVGQPDVERLAAAPQREQHVVGVGGRARGDRHRAFEARHRVAERRREVGPFRQAMRHEGGDDLGVGRDLGGQPEPVGRLQISEVVDVTVEGRRHVRTGRAVELQAVDGMGVGLRDDADARPARVAEDDGGGALVGQRQSQQIVGEHVGAHGRRVVTELTDLRGRLVDEAEVALRGAHGVRAEQVVRAARARPGAPRRDRRDRGRGPGRAR